MASASIGSTTTYEHAETALEIALYLHCFGTASTLAWLAAGRPDEADRHEDRTVFQEARAIVHENRGRIKRGDVEKLLDRLRSKGVRS